MEDIPGITILREKIQMSKSQASQIAQEAMKSGNNCCQSVLLAANKVWDIPVGEDILAAASLFAQGMSSGCTCGALTGMVMAAGIMHKSYPHPAGSKLPQQLHDQFKQEFGSTCCRVIRKNRSPIEKIGNKGCIKLTSRTAEILVAEWEGYSDVRPEKPTPDIGYNTNSR
jgi:C_GCAxxG_C_C family probable redox protein